MELRSQCLYKIWQLMPYTKYGNSCPIKNMASVSQSSCPPSELPGAPPKSIFLFFELEEAWSFWRLRPPPLGL